MSRKGQIAEFERSLRALRQHPVLSKYISDEIVEFAAIPLSDLAVLLQDPNAAIFLSAAAGLDRTKLRRESKTEEALLVKEEHRAAFAVQSHLPMRQPFQDVFNRAVADHTRVLNRRARSKVEDIFRDRLAEEGIPVAMSPPLQRIEGLLIDKRKPDGVYPPPAQDTAPLLYLEIKSVRRVRDDIQKRLYEIAEAALEMKLLYGDGTLKALAVKDMDTVSESRDELREQLRAQVCKLKPVVVALLICANDERKLAERYRAGGHAFVDRIFFHDEIDECLAFIRSVVEPE